MNVQTKAQQQVIFGGFSFDGDSLPDYSEFDSDSVTLDYQKERFVNFILFLICEKYLCLKITHLTLLSF